MKPIHTERLILRNWEERDRDLFHRINFDERVMEFFPFRRTRTQSDAKMDEFRKSIEIDGYGWTAAEIAATGQCIGFVGLNHAGHIDMLPADTIEIGWRLAPEFWRHGYVTETARAWLAYAFQVLHLSEIVSFTVFNNRRSVAVMERLGMSASPAMDFDHPSVPDSHPHLKRHVLYRMAHETWEKQQKRATS